MRYIYYIIAILLILSAVFAFELIPAPMHTKKAALIINNRIITVDEFKKLYSSRVGHTKGKEDFINSLITKELLIQESQKEGIDKEETFRRSIQNYYEQTLIKQLMDRQCGSRCDPRKLAVSDGELQRYIALLNKKLHLTIFTFSSPEEAKKSTYRNGESKAVNFEDLSKDLKDIVLPLRKGEMSGSVRTGEKYIVVRLDDEQEMSSHQPLREREEDIKKILIEAKREKAINAWITDLRNKASVKILVDGNN